MAKRWVVNSATGPRHIGGKLLQPGEGTFVDDGPLNAPAQAVVVAGAGISDDALAALALAGTPVPARTLLADPATQLFYGQSDGLGGYLALGGGSVALTDAEFAALVAADGLQLGIIYRVGTPEVWYRATGVDTYTLASWGDSIEVSVPGATNNLIEV